MRLRAAALLSGLLWAGPASAQVTLNEAAKQMVGASWEFSSAERDKTCIVTFKAERAGSAAYKVEFEPKCAEDFPMVRDIAAWTYPDNDLLHLLDARGKSLIDFSEVESGIFEAPTPGFGVLFLQNAADAGAPPIKPEQVAGDWAIMRGAGKPLCQITLTTTPAADEGFAVVVKPGCDAAITRFNFNRWKVDRDQLMILPARGNAWRFEQSDSNNWERVPESANPYTLVRQ
jgi:hypothetical protein